MLPPNLYPFYCQQCLFCGQTVEGWIRLIVEELFMALACSVY